MERHQSRKPHVGFQTVCCQVQSEGSQPSSYWIYAKMLHVLHKTEQGKGVIFVGGAEVDSATRVRRTHSLQRMVYIQAGPRKLQSWRPSSWKRSSGKFTICQSRMERCYLLPGARGVRVGFRTFYTFQDKSTIARE